MTTFILCPNLNGTFHGFITLFNLLRGKYYLKEGNQSWHSCLVFGFLCQVGGKVQILGNNTKQNYIY